MNLRDQYGSLRKQRLGERAAKTDNFTKSKYILSKGLKALHTRIYIAGNFRMFEVPC